MKVVTALGLIIILFTVAAFISQRNITPNSQPESSTEEINSDKKPQTEVIAENLDTPWDMEVLPDGNILSTERSGSVVLIMQNGNVQKIADINNVREIGEGGLLGMALDPDFANNNYVYFYYTYAGSGNNTQNRVIRMSFTEKALSNEEILIDNIPGASNHNGGQIAFGPDGNLYITTGDAQEPSQAQNRDSLAGKILRYVNGKTEVLSYGHRNPQGIDWDSNGNLWSSEHGRSGVLSGLDEINLIIEGRNYGWPEIEGDETKEGMETPKINSGNTTWAPSGLAIIGNKIYFSGLRGNALYSVTINGENLSQPVEYFKGEFGRIRAVVTGPDDKLYISTSNKDGRGNPDSTDDKIIRINPNLL